MKKLVFSLLAIATLFVACDSDDEGNGITPNAGTITGGPFSFFVDGNPDMVNGIATDANAVGSNRTFVITDANNTILGTPPDVQALEGVDFDGAGVGNCLIWYLRYEDGLSGLEVGQNTSGFDGDFDLSNSILVTRNEGPNAGVLSGNPFTFCVDGVADTVSGISTDPNAVGTNRSFVVTDADGNILGLPPTLTALEGVNFDGAGPGVCLVWYLRYEEGLSGLTVGANVDGLSGVFDFSNSIAVTRNAQPNAGTISGGPFNFTVDGTPDMVSGITLDGTATGTNGTWVVTDANANILGLPPTLMALEGVNFDAAGPGVCLIWYLRFEDGLQGAAVGANANDLEGCFELSNSISVNRS